MLGFGGGNEAVKVLRIGIVKDGKVVHERLIKPGQNVTVGESAEHLRVSQLRPPKRFTLFQAKGGKYRLNVTKAMGGKFAREGGVADISKIARHPTSKKG